MSARVTRSRILELLYASGLRISELVNARLENLNLEERILRVTGRETRRAWCQSDAKLVMRSHHIISTERPTLVKRRSGSEIFLSSRGTKLTTVRIGRS
jgi:integrase/recombinase XerD